MGGLHGRRTGPGPARAHHLLCGDRPSMHMHATAIVYPDGSDAWFASCPGIEGAYVCAGSRDEALERLKEVLRDLLAEGRPVVGPPVEVAAVEA